MSERNSLERFRWSRSAYPH